MSQPLLQSCSVQSSVAATGLPGLRTLELIEIQLPFTLATFQVPRRRGARWLLPGQRRRGIASTRQAPSWSSLEAKLGLSLAWGTETAASLFLSLCSGNCKRDVRARPLSRMRSRVLARGVRSPGPGHSPSA